MEKDNQIGRLVVFQWIGYAPQTISISASQVESDSVSEVLARLAAISSREKAEGISYGIPHDNPCPDAPWCWNIYLQNWAIFGVNVGKYSSTLEHLG